MGFIKDVDGGNAEGGLNVSYIIRSWLDDGVHASSGNDRRALNGSKGGANDDGAHAGTGSAIMSLGFIKNVDGDNVVGVLNLSHIICSWPDDRVHAGSGNDGGGSKGGLCFIVLDDVDEREHKDGDGGKHDVFDDEDIDGGKHDDDYNVVEDNWVLPSEEFENKDNDHDDWSTSSENVEDEKFDKFDFNDLPFTVVVVDDDYDDADGKSSSESDTSSSSSSDED